VSLVFDLPELIDNLLLPQIFFCPLLEMFPWLEAIWSKLRKGIKALQQPVSQVTDGTDRPYPFVRWNLTF